MQGSRGLIDRCKESSAREIGRQIGLDIDNARQTEELQRCDRRLAVQRTTERQIFFGQTAIQTDTLKQTHILNLDLDLNPSTTHPFADAIGQR